MRNRESKTEVKREINIQEMEQVRRQNQHQQQERPQTPLKCPRCDSVNTKFRYFNNQNLAQPRYLCKSCNRLWTEGGSLRDVPIGGNKRNKQTGYDSLGSHSHQPPLPTGEALQSLYYMPTMASIPPQIFDVTGVQPDTSLPQTIDPVSSLYFNNALSNLDTVNPLLQPEVVHQAANVWNQASGNTADVAFLKDWNIQSFASHQAFPQQIPGYQNQSIIVDPGMVGINQVHVPAGSYHSSNHDMFQPTWPMNFLPQEPINLPGSFSTSDVGLGDNTNGNATNMELPTTSVNPYQWPNFPGYCPP